MKNFVLCAIYLYLWFHCISFLYDLISKTQCINLANFYRTIPSPVHFYRTIPSPEHFFLISLVSLPPSPSFSLNHYHIPNSKLKNSLYSLYTKTYSNTSSDKYINFPLLVFNTNSCLRL